MMTYKQIEASREIRLWVTQIIVPGVIIGAMILTNPNVKEKLKTCKNKIKEVTKKNRKTDHDFVA